MFASSKIITYQRINSPEKDILSNSNLYRPLPSKRKSQYSFAKIKSSRKNTFNSLSSKIIIYLQRLNPLGEKINFHHSRFKRNYYSQVIKSSGKNTFDFEQKSLIFKIAKFSRKEKKNSFDRVRAKLLFTRIRLNPPPEKEGKSSIILLPVKEYDPLKNFVNWR